MYHLIFIEKLNHMKTSLVSEENPKKIIQDDDENIHIEETTFSNNKRQIAFLVEISLAN